MTFIASLTDVSRAIRFALAVMRRHAPYGRERREPLAHLGSACR